jgi:hypothetical protein
MTKGFLPGCCKKQGHYVAPDQQIKLTSPTLLKKFWDMVSAPSSVVAAAAVTGSANGVQQLSSKAKAAITAAMAAHARHQKIMKMTKQRQMSRGSQAVAAQHVLQVAKATKRGGKNLKCSACGQHKTNK